MTVQICPLYPTMAARYSHMHGQGTEEEVMKELAQRLMAVTSATEAAAPEGSAPQPSSRTASGNGRPSSWTGLLDVVLRCFS